MTVHKNDQISKKELPDRPSIEFMNDSWDDEIMEQTCNPGFDQIFKVRKDREYLKIVQQYLRSKCKIGNAMTARIRRSSEWKTEMLLLRAKLAVIKVLLDPKKLEHRNAVPTQLRKRTVANLVPANGPELV